MESSTKDKPEGKLHKVKRKIRQVAGEADDKAENVDGKVQEKIAEIKADIGK